MNEASVFSPQGLLALGRTNGPELEKAGLLSANSLLRYGRMNI